MLTAAQQLQTPIKFDVPAFDGDSTASWLTWSQRVLYQARASGFENELTAAEGDGLSVGADVFDSSNVDPVRLRNAHVAWMTLINSCSGITLEIVQRSNAPNEACVCVCVFFPSILDIEFVGRTSRGHTGGRSHRIFNPHSFCGACLDFCREKDSAIPFPRRP